MKTLNLMLLLLVLTVAASAQSAPGNDNAPGVSVVSHRWREVVRNPALDEDPMRANDEQREAMRTQRDIIRENAIRVADGRLPLPPPRRTPSRILVGNSSSRYVYETVIRNTGTNTIREVVWEHVVFETNTQREVGHRRFTTRANIRPGRSKRLIGDSTSPPASTIDASQTGEQNRGNYSERVVIHRISYTDGSVWQRGSN
jgi:hypothetical protein